MISAITKSGDDTRDLAAAVATLVRGGDVILVSGELGSGKTTFAQGFARGLGVTEPVVSPTFTLVRSYQGRLVLAHCDVYRLDHMQEVIDLGLPEMLDDGAVALVEWGEVVGPTLATDFLQVRLEFADEDDERRCELRPAGPSWTRRARELRSSLGRWQA